MSNANEEEPSYTQAASAAPVVNHLKVNNNTLTKSEQEALLRSVLPSLNGQEGSPANTFTSSELHELQKAVGSISVGPRGCHARKSSNNTVDIRDLQSTFACPQEGNEYVAACPQDGSEDIVESKPPAAAAAPAPPLVDLDWHGAPRLHKDVHLSRSFREQVRYGNFTGPTNGVCPGFLQCNLVILPQGPVAFDFLLFCQRNPKACPLIEVCDVGSPFPHGVAPGADLRTDVPK